MEKTETIETILSRGVTQFVDPGDVFVEKLKKNPKSIVIKFGVDPTRPDIHLGHAVIFRTLRRFQELGAKVVFLVGDITAQIGDPTGKSKIRPEVNQGEIEANMKSFLDQVGKVINTDPSVFAWTRNSDWYVSVTDIIAKDQTPITISVGNQSITTPSLPGDHILAKANAWVASRMQKGNVRNYSLINVLSILRRITYSRLVERDMFQDRIKNGEPVFMHEMLYPVLQGIDSNVLADIFTSCDLEVGGNDQYFNMLMGREVMELNNKKPQAVLTFKLLEGTDGKEKMSKSLDNYIAITDSPADMYGKVLSIPDTSIGNYFELCTYTPLERIQEIEEQMNKGKLNPKNAKMELARQIVAEYHGEQAAEKAEKEFVHTFGQKGIPESIETITVSKESLADELVTKELVASKTELHRLLSSGAIQNLDTNEKVNTLSDFISGNYRIGAKRFIKIALE